MKKKTSFKKLGRVMCLVNGALSKCLMYNWFTKPWALLEYKTRGFVTSGNFDDFFIITKPRLLH